MRYFAEHVASRWKRFYASSPTGWGPQYQGDDDWHVYERLDNPERGDRLRLVASFSGFAAEMCAKLDADERNKAEQSSGKAPKVL